MNNAKLDEKVTLEPLSDLEESELVDGIQDIRGYAVLSSNGNEIGRINELFIDLRNQHMNMASLRIGGFLGIGAKTILVPIEQLEILDNNCVRVKTKDEVLTEAPEFSETGIPDYNYQVKFWNIVLKR